MHILISGINVKFWDWAQNEPTESGQCVYTDSSEIRSGWHSENCSRQLESVICSISMFIFFYKATTEMLWFT